MTQPDITPLPAFPPDEGALTRRIASCFAAGWPLDRIAHTLDLNPHIVRQHLTPIREQWQRRAQLDRTEALGRELLTLDELERAAWDGWHASRRDEITTTTTHADKGDSEQIKRVTHAGDINYLKVVERCVEMRCKLLGLPPPLNDEPELMVRTDDLAEVFRLMARYERDETRS